MPHGGKVKTLLNKHQTSLFLNSLQVLLILVSQSWFFPNNETEPQITPGLFSCTSHTVQVQDRPLFSSFASFHFSNFTLVPTPLVTDLFLRRPLIAHLAVTEGTRLPRLPSLHGLHRSPQRGLFYELSWTLEWVLLLRVVPPTSPLCTGQEPVEEIRRSKDAPTITQVVLRYPAPSEQ